MRSPTTSRIPPPPTPRQESLGGQFAETRTLMPYLFSSMNFGGDAAPKPHEDLLQGVGTKDTHVELIGTTIARLLDDAPGYSGKRTDPVDAPGALPVDAADSPWSGPYVYNSGNLITCRADHQSKADKLDRGGSPSGGTEMTTAVMPDGGAG